MHVGRLAEHGWHLLLLLLLMVLGLAEAIVLVLLLLACNQHCCRRGLICLAVILGIVLLYQALLLICVARLHFSKTYYDEV